MLRSSYRRGSGLRKSSFITVWTFVTEMCVGKIDCSPNVIEDIVQMRAQWLTRNPHSRSGGSMTGSYDIVTAVKVLMSGFSLYQVKMYT